METIMGKKIRLSESALAKIIKESVMDEIDRRTVMPGKYYEIFKNRIINAQHGSFGDVDRTIMEFFKDFKDRIPNEGFTPENLKDLAEKIEGGDTTHERGNMPGGHKVKDADGWWGRNAGKYLEEKKVKVTEGQLRKLIKESVMKALVNEISSKKWGEISNSIHKNYGGADFPGPKATRFDDHGNPIYGKKGKTVASLYRKLDAAKKDAIDYEKTNSPESEWDEKAIQITQDYEPDEEEAEMDGGWYCLYDTWNNLKTEDGVWPYITLAMREGDPKWVRYEAPDGTEREVDL